MALQSTASGADPLRFSEIQTEFAAQGSASNFRAYLKNAGIVDSNDTAPNVPTSGTMNMLQFLGAAIVTLSVNLPQYNPSGGYDVVLSSTDYRDISDPFDSQASALIALYSNGAGLYRTMNSNIGDTDYTFTWLTSGSASSAYAFMDTLSGDAADGTSSAINTSLVLSTTRAWQWTATVPSSGDVSKVATTTLRIKNSSGTDLDTVSVSIYVYAQKGSL